jgi:hypothetical protein
MMLRVGIGWSDILFGTGVLGLAGFAAVVVVRLPKVWRGETLPSLPWASVRGPEVNHRSFAAFTGFIVGLSGGAVLVWIGMLTDITGLTIVGGLAIVLGVLVFVPLWIVVNAVNRRASWCHPSAARTVAGGRSGAPDGVDADQGSPPPSTWWRSSTYGRRLRSGSPTSRTSSRCAARTTAAG